MPSRSGSERTRRSQNPGHKAGTLKGHSGTLTQPSVLSLGSLLDSRTLAQVAHVLIDPVTDAAYYLGFDLLLARAPVVEGEVRTADSHIVEHEDDVQLAARYAAVKVALLTAWLGDDDVWRSTVDEARLTALELAREAGLSSPPTLEGSEIRELDLGPAS